MSDKPSGPALTFTGERFTPECVREIWYEHWHRYAFTRSLARGKRVLDAACGEGYGSALLAEVATSVLGMDIAEGTIAHAQQRYGTSSNLKFVDGDVAALDLPSRSYELVVSFETIEHLHEQEALIAGFSRVLTDDGLLVISSPDKRVYSDEAGFRNEFHVRELYREEFLALLKAHFPYIHLYGQKLLFQSVIWELDTALGQGVQVTTADGHTGSITNQWDYAPLYFIAVCARQPLQDRLPGLALFGDREESVYRHYNHEVRKNIAAGGRISKLESELAKVVEENQGLRASLENAQAASMLPTSAFAPAWWQRLWRWR